VPIPNLQYNSLLGSDTFNYKLLQTNITESISITPGIYSESSLVTALNNSLTASEVNIAVSFNSGVNTLTFMGVQKMEFHFAESNSINPLILGFVTETYTSKLHDYIITSPCHRQPSYQCFYLPPILSPFLGLRQGAIKAQVM